MEPEVAAERILAAVETDRLYALGSDQHRCVADRVEYRWSTTQHVVHA